MSLFCIDVGGTETKFARSDGQILSEKNSCPTLYGDSGQFLDFLAGLWKECGADCEGIAISMPGRIDGEAGYVENAGGMLRQVRETPLARLMEERTGVPTSVENDAKCAALAELSTGALRGCQSGAVVILGTGVGGALIQNGKLYRGAHLFAGEFSYVHINQDDFDCKESVLAVRCGGKELRKSAANLLSRPESQVDGHTIFNLTEAGDERMLTVITTFSRQIARFIYNLQCIYDPEKIAIGGGVSARPLLIEIIQQEVDAIYDHDIFELPRPVVVGSKYHNDANLIGACCHYQELHSANMGTI